MAKNRINDDMVVKDVGHKTVVVDVNTAKYFTFNETANFIWSCLRKGMSDEEIRAKFQDEFDVTADVFERDYRSFMADMRSKKLVVCEEGSKHG